MLMGLETQNQPGHFYNEASNAASKSASNEDQEENCFDWQANLSQELHLYMRGCMHLRCPTHSEVLSHSTNSNLPSAHSRRSRESSQKPARNVLCNHRETPLHTIPSILLHG